MKQRGTTYFFIASPPDWFRLIHDSVPVRASRAESVTLYDLDAPGQHCGAPATAAGMSGQSRPGRVQASARLLGDKT
ncbi:MAG: hypothetical protein NTX53_14650 [candidate division WOR-3 bacterium]|nr:hypothetical protein [candidate division WOR-3 bacterium]